MAKEMKVINHKAGKIDLRYLGTHVKEFKPIELHHMDHGSVTDEASFAVVMELLLIQSKVPIYAVGQFSLVTLQECLNELGYEIKKKET